MKPYMLVFVCTALPALLSGANGALAQSDKSGVERLYVLNCGRGHAADQSLWSPGVNVGTAIDVSDNCYLIKHKQGWFLWDTGVPDAVAAMPMACRRPIRARQPGAAQ